jgi:transcriptional regulator with XRE-family HTH domain
MGQIIEFPRRATTATEVAAPLWREAAGGVLREERRAQDRTLADVARSAGVSAQYLSEVERGRKEPSSEVLEAVTAALDLRLVDLTARVTRRLATTQITGPVCLAA